MPDTYVAYYVSADAPGQDVQWSVYSEHYRTPEYSGEPIDGSQHLISTWPTEQAAENAALVLAMLNRHMNRLADGLEFEVDATDEQ